MIGKEIHHYKILEKLGEGGMGVVYKAQDTKLDRIVALKFLPTHSLGNDDDRKRFETEAKAAAALNHPNIATVYEINDHEGDTFIAMEFVDGDTLEDKIKKAPLKIKDAMKIAKQVADGLSAAHEKDIFHRDIKGSNVMITPKGVVKIMDFGLAKMSSATIVTKAGMTLGTVGYMSPEQSKGEEVDHRTDIWSLGVVFYEMIAGVRPFKGEYETALVYSILNVDPEPLTGLRTGVPMRLEEIINKLLAKDPDERYQNIVELPVDLKNVNLKDVGTSQIGSSVISETHIKDRQVDVKFSFSRRNAILMGISAVIFFTVGWFLKPGPPTPEPRSVRKYQVPLPENYGVFDSNLNRMAISPDGTKIVYINTEVPRTFQLYDLYTGETIELEGTLEGRSPFFFPDGRSIGFVVPGPQELKTVLIDGGSPLLITTWTGSRNEGSAGLGPGNSIIFADGGGLSQISLTSDTPDTLTRPKNVEEVHYNPHLLPEEKYFLFTISNILGETSDNRIAIYSFDTGQYRILLNEESYNPVYVKTGHILYGRAGMVMAVPFDIATLEINGLPVSILNSVDTHPNTGSMNFSISSEGTAVFVEGDLSGTGTNRGVFSLDMDGNTSLIYENNTNIQDVDYSPDGKTILIQSEERNVANLFLYNIAGGGAISDLTFETVSLGSRFPVWSPDSKWIVFQRFLGINEEIYLKKADNTGQQIKIFEGGSPTDWSKDGRYIFFNRNADLFYYSFEDSTEHELFGTQVAEFEPVLSPDGRYFAYTSEIGGSQNIYVRPFPDANNGVWKISGNENGLYPLWSVDGKKLYYLAPPTDIYAVDVNTEGILSYGIPKPVINLPRGVIVNEFQKRFDIHPDGNSFLITANVDQVVDDDTQQEFTIIENFFEEIKRLAPVNKE